MQPTWHTTNIEYAPFPLKFDRSIEGVGDVLISQFEGEMGDRMKSAYGEFCSRHNEAVQLYKDILKSERKFQNFVKVRYLALEKYDA